MARDVRELSDSLALPVFPEPPEFPALPVLPVTPVVVVVVVAVDDEPHAARPTPKARSTASPASLAARDEVRPDEDMAAMAVPPRRPSIAVGPLGRYPRVLPSCRTAQATKYLAWGWWQMMASVVCSGCSWNPSETVTPMRSAPSSIGDRRVVGEVGARRVAPRVAPAAVLLAEQALDGRAVLVGVAQLLADAPVPQLGQRLGHLDAEPVQLEVVGVAVLAEELLAPRRHPRAHRDEHERRVVAVRRLDRPEEVRDAQPRLGVLAREDEARALRRAVVVGEDDEVGAVRGDRQVAPDDLGDEQLVGDRPCRAPRGARRGRGP